MAHSLASRSDATSVEQYDAVKLREKVLATPAAPEAAEPTQRKIDLPVLPAHLVQRFVPNPQLSMTKREEWQTRQEIDGMLGRATWTGSPRRFGKADQLAHLYEFVDRELHALNAPEMGPDFRRLQVYSAVWERVINEFKLYGPVLAEIKASHRNEYDKTVASFQNDQRELYFLRTKVQKLLSQNENRLLIKYERRKIKALEAKYAALEAENHQLKEDLRRKLAMYAAYLPPSVLETKKKEDPALEELEEGIKVYKLGEDPISKYESRIESLEQEVALRDTQITSLHRVQEEEFVPKAEKEGLEKSLGHAEIELASLKSQNATLQTQIADQKTRLEHIAATVKEKQTQYDFLYKEYK
ncbi:hypothetical protein HKX48_004441 [Thoreauomyces humboldtii]|nr:hypothetical protein HKX48_004441 [Thoreauomyces humboldtii]